MNPHTTTSSFLAGLSGTLLSAGLAAACPTIDAADHRVQKRIVTPALADQRGGVVICSDDDSTRIELVGADDVALAKLSGRTIPARRFVTDAGRLTLLDENDQPVLMVANWAPQPQRARLPEPGPRSTLTVTGQSSDLLIIRDGKIATLRIDGKDLPADRAKREGDSWVVRDENNAVLAEFPATGLGVDEKGEIRLESLRSSDGLPRVVRSIRMLNDLPIVGFYGEADGPAPKVMIGITMIPPSEDLLAHFGLDADAVTLVGSVSPDTPAAKAGLKENDLITAVAGGKATAEAIRDVLRTKKPGDQLQLTVIQKGVQRELTLTLAERNEAALNAGGNRFRGLGGFAPFEGLPENAPGLSPEDREAINDRVREALSQTRQQIEESQRQMGEAQRQMNEAQRQMNQAQRQQGQRNQLGQIFRDERNRNIYVTPGQTATPPVPPTPPAPPAPPGAAGAAPASPADAAEVNARLNRLDERLARLEQLLEKLVAKPAAAPASSSPDPR